MGENEGNDYVENITIDTLFLSGTLLLRSERWCVVQYVSSKSLLDFVLGNLNAFKYIANVLVPYLQRLPRSVFQQHNASSHMAQATLQYLEKTKVKVVLWPVY